MKSMPNVVLISVDSLGADHLGCYGYRRATSPFLDSFAQSGTMLERLYCPGLPTYPSYTTLYTGQHPLTHGILAHGGNARVAREAPFLPQSLLDAGYTTCAVDNLLRGRAWFGRGYEHYIDPSWRHNVLTVAVTSEELNARAIPWLKAHASEPFFFFIHYWDPHWPFNPPKRYDGLFYSGRPTDPANRSLDDYWKHPLGAIARETWLRTADGLITDAEYVSALYDREIRHVDDGIRDLVTALDELGLSENTIVVVTGDHGESLTEHEIYFDHHGLYDCTIHVPFIVRWPGHVLPGKRLPQMFQISDIAPTLLEATGGRAPSTMEGRSFWKLLTGEETEGGHERIVSAESTWQAAWSLRTDKFKLILTRHSAREGWPTKELYDLSADPREEHNLAEKKPDVTGAMTEELERWIAQRLQALGKKEDPLTAIGPTMKNTLEENP